MNKTLNFILVVSFIKIVSPANLANYITACKKEDPNLNKCARKSANNAIHAMVQGDPTIGLPSLNPYILDKLDFDTGRNLVFHLSNLKMGGYNAVDVRNFTIDLKKKHWHIEMHLDRAQALADSKVNGQLLILPIQGEGPANVTFIDSLFIYDYFYDLYKKNGREYMKTKDTNFDFTVKRAYLKFENLFGGNPVLGKEIDKLLIENWKEVLDEMKPSLNDFYNKVTTQILELYVKKVPYDEIFLD